ncbi:HEPN domain-containing protein [Acidianus manzaensis]|uniref:DNA-binding protein n=1 Tax=Acidianus manzaensis TaxID=282676 RepID=A0A1W6K2U6_9CREN|nr:HEPN domain-containing protein [Acidianus manzaensis]ARM76815.1 DNA-binding protein [Acidianus manzaensis]
MKYTDWIAQANEDLSASEILLNNGKYFASAYYSQQAVEKILKALLLHLGKDPDMNSLTELVELIENEGVSVPQNIKEDAMILSPHFIISRYPDAANGVPAKQYSKSMATDLLKRAKEVIQWVKEKVQ